MKYLLSLFFLFLYSFSWTQPANDDCAGIIDLGVVPSCPETIYDNIDATATNIGNDNDPGCFDSDTPTNDVWFQFKTDTEITDYEISIISTEDGPNVGIQNIQFALYRGFCGVDNLFLNSCKLGASGETEVNLFLTDLTPDETYFLRVDNYMGDDSEGDFKICIDEKTPDITDGFSSDCEGELVDSGGEDGNYGNNENNAFTICPEEFHQCVIFNLEYYNIDESGDAITFYNGPSINAPQITSITGSGFDDNGGGGVCFKVQADSCITIQLTSDSSLNFEGFKANWYCTAEPCVENETLNTIANASYEEIGNAISTPLAKVTVDTVDCTGINGNVGFGVFDNGANTNLGLEKGIILTSGNVDNVGNPASFGTTGVIGTEGDEDLDILSILQGDENQSNDACIIEVDVEVYSEKLEFDYIFGSEEYPEFVNANFNDIFALFIEGPGIVGQPGLGGKSNMAVIPGTNTEISINSVNHLSNWQYYRNNKDSESIVYDGLTSGFLGENKYLTASATVQPCSTYHLKFAIADRGDNILDSGVFISEIRSGEPSITTFSSGLDYFVEKCFGNSTDTVNILLNSILPDTAIFYTQIDGTATNGVDYSFDLPDTIYFEPGDTILKFPIQIFDDNIEEGDETFIIRLFREVGCENTVATEIEVIIRENALVEIELENDSLNVCAFNDTKISATGANSYVWTPFTEFDDPFIDAPLINAGYTGWVYVEGKILPFTDPTCTGFDSVFINSVEPEINLLHPDTIDVCAFDTVKLNVESNLDESLITWTNINGFMIDNEGYEGLFFSTFNFNFTTQVIATAEIGGCIAQDTVVIRIDPYLFIRPLFTDTTICENTELLLNEQRFFSNQATIDWSPETFLDNPDDPFTFATPDESINYQLITTSLNEICADTFNYEVTVIPNEVEILQGDEIRICFPDTVDLDILTDPIDATITWEPMENIEINSNLNVSIYPDKTTNYIVTSSNGICSTTDEIRVYVDSLPLDMSITAIPVRDPYCKGEIISFISPKYELYKFPLIEHLWSPNIGQGQNSNNDDYNYTISAQETTTYIRTTTNGACTVEDSIMINVIDPSIELNIPDTTICSGQNLDFVLTGNGEEIDNIEWESDSGEFTCDDCEETTLENITESTTVSVQADVDGCPANTSMEVTVLDYGGNITLDTMLECNFFGDILNMTAEIFPEPPVGSTIQWFGPDGELVEFLNSYTAVVTLPGDDGSDIESLSYYWTLETPDGCTGSGGIEICVTNRFDVPNAFSPNDDGRNDVFRVVDYGVGPSAVEILAFDVYNRMGQKVYVCEEFDCATVTGWNGIFNGQIQPGGTYFYYIKMRYPDGSILEFDGDLLLLR